MSDILGILQQTVSNRILYLGWSAAKALSTPARKHVRMQK